MKENVIDDLLNDARNQEVDKEFHNFYNNVLNNLPEKKKVHKSMPIVAAIALIVLSCTFVFSSSAFANGSITKAIMNFIGKDDKLISKYSTEINKSVINKGITVKIDEVALDSNSIIVKYTVKSENSLKKLSEDGQMLHIGFFLDLGRPYGITGMGYLPRSDGKTYNCFLDDNTYSALEAYSTDQLELEDKFKLGIRINSIGNKKGRWNFDFDVDKTLVQKASKTVYPKKQFIYDGKEYRIDRVSISPLSSAIDISLLNGSQMINFIVIDDKDTKITIGSASLTKNNNSSIQRLKFNGYDILPNKITIVPQDEEGNYDLKNGISVDLNDGK